jgi:hypothetical protein
MTTITANIPDNLTDKVRQFIEGLGGEVTSEFEPSAKEMSDTELDLLHRAEDDKQNGRVSSYTSHRGILGR